MTIATRSGDVLEAAGLHNPHVHEFVQHWAAITCPARIEVVSPESDTHLLEEALAAGELLAMGPGRYLARSHPKDTARSEERTVVATSNEGDRGRYNNWRPTSEIKPVLVERMSRQSAGKTMYVIPYLMAPQGTPLEKYAVGVELTDDRVVALQMLRMARVHASHVENLADPSFFVRGVHVTGDLDKLGQGTPEDQRLFATIADERTILHFGSAYGGNALLGKIAHALRLASYDGWASGEFLAEQFLLLGIRDTHTGRRFHVVGGFPSASGKTNLAMTRAPEELGGRYEVEFFGDDIAWMWPGEDGRLYAFNPENGIFGVAKDTNADTNPEAMHAIRYETGALFTNVAYNEQLQDVWWEGKTAHPPENVVGWKDWTGEYIAERSPLDADKPWAHPNSRFTTTLTNLATLSPEYAAPQGVPVDAVIFGGRTSDREPLIRVLDTLADGVYDGLTLGAEATFAAEGIDGQLRYDPMSMRPFLSYPEGRYAQHWLRVLSQCSRPPAFAHVNWFQKDPDTGRFRWPGYRDNVRALIWLWDYLEDRAGGERTAIGTIPRPEDINLEGLTLADEDLAALLTVDVERWLLELERRCTHLEQFPDLPHEIWEAHAHLSARLRDA